MQDFGQKEEISPPTTRKESVRFVVDGHVHLYSVEKASAQVRRACRRLAAMAHEGDHHRIIPTLIVLNTVKFDVFASLYGSAPTRGEHGFVKAGDEYGLWLLDEGVEKGLLIGGAQIAAREGFEVLAVGCNVPPRKQQAAVDIIEYILAAGGLPVLPWAFGKWIGGRGQEIARILGGEYGTALLLGDNALRPTSSPKPRPFRLAEEMHKPILPGSDPLPLDGDERRIGSYGFEIDGQLSFEAPVSSFLCILRQARRQPRTIGRRLGMVASLAKQLRIRIAKPVETTVRLDK